MAHIIRVYYGDQLFSIDLLMHGNQASIGAGNGDSVRLDAHGLADGHVKFVNVNDMWIVKAKKHLYRESSQVSSEPLYEGVTYTLATEPAISIAVHPKQEDSTKIVRLNSNTIFNIGRDTRNEIAFSNMRTSSKHCKIFKDDGGYKIKDCGSRNGTFVNGKKVTERLLNNGDIINVSVYQMIFENNTLSFMNVGSDASFRVPTEEKEIVSIKSAPKAGVYEPDESTRKGTLSLFGGGGDAPKKKGTVSVFDLDSDANPEPGEYVPDESPRAGTFSLFGGRAEKPEKKGTVSVFDLDSDANPEPGEYIPDESPRAGTFSLFGGRAEKPKKGTVSVFDLRREEKPEPGEYIPDERPGAGTFSLFGNREEKPKKKGTMSVFDL